MKTETLDTEFPHNSHQILVEKDAEKYRVVVSAAEQPYSEGIKGVLSVRKMTEDGWKAMLNISEEIEKAAIKNRMEAEE